MYLSDSFLTISGSIAAFLNGIFRLGSGSLMHRFEFKKPYAVFLIFQLINSLIIFHVRSLQILYPLCITIGFIGHGIHISAFPSLIEKIFGKKNGEKLEMIIMIAPCLSVLTIALLMHLTNDFIGGLKIHLIAAGFTLANLIIVRFFFDEEKAIVTVD